MPRPAHRQPRLRIHRLQTHQTHQTLHPFAIDLMPRTPQPGRQASAAPERMGRVLAIEQRHQRQVLGRLRRRLVVVARAAQAQQFTLLAQQIRPGTVALIVTAYPNSPRAETALATGAWKIVPKPVELPQLLALVDEAVDQPLILVVDDDPDLCANLWDLLRERGFRVCVAHFVSTAIERLQEASAFRVILLDMKLPDGNGSQVFRQARAVNPNAQVVLITAHRAEMEPRLCQALAEGAQAVLPKPFDVPELLSTLKRLTTGNEEPR